MREYSHTLWFPFIPRPFLRRKGEGWGYILKFPQKYFPDLCARLGFIKHYSRQKIPPRVWCFIFCAAPAGVNVFVDILNMLKIMD